MENKEIEKRAFAVRANADSRTIVGTPIVFNSRSQNLGFYEIIEPSAFTQEDVSRFDIRVVYQHQDSFIPMARSNKGKGSLKINVDENGVNIEFEAKKTAASDEVLEAVRQGDVDKMSFAFLVDREGQKVSRAEDGTILRSIIRFKDVKEFSILGTEPAYAATTVNVRSLEEVLEEETRDLAEVERLKVEADKAEADKVAAQKKVDDDKAYWQKYDDILKKYKENKN